MQLVKTKSYWRRVGPRSNMTDVLIERGNLDTDIHAGRTPCEDWSDAVIAQEPPEAGETWNRSFPGAFRVSTALLTP